MILFRKPRLVAALACAATVCVALSVPSQSSASGTMDSFLPELPDSAQVTTPVVAKGRAVTPRGAADGGAMVVLYAWPAQEDMAVMQPGDTLKLQPIAKAVAGQTGSYALRIPGGVHLSSLAGGDGIVNLQVVAYGQDTSTSFSFPRKVATIDRTQRLVDPDLGASATAAEVAAGVAPVAVPEDAAQLALPDGASHATAVEKSCSTTLMDDWKRWDLVGQAYHGVDGVPIDFTYSNDAYSELGVAVSASGSYGSWKVEGTQGESSNDTVGFPTLTGDDDRYYKTMFRYGKFYQYCVTVAGFTTHKYFFRSMNFAGGADEDVPASVPSTPKDYCVEFSPGSSFTKNTTHSVTWTNGMNVSDVIGIDLETRTGYSSMAKVYFDFNKRRDLCGTGGDPGATPYQLVVRSEAFAP